MPTTAGGSKAHGSASSLKIAGLTIASLAKSAPRCEKAPQANAYQYDGRVRSAERKEGARGGLLPAVLKSSNRRVSTNATLRTIATKKMAIATTSRFLLEHAYSELIAPLLIVISGATEKHSPWHRNQCCGMDRKCTIDVHPQATVMQPAHQRWWRASGVGRSMERAVGEWIDTGVDVPVLRRHPYEIPADRCKSGTTHKNPIRGLDDTCCANASLTARALTTRWDGRSAAAGVTRMRLDRT